MLYLLPVPRVCMSPCPCVYPLSVRPPYLPVLICVSVCLSVFVLSVCPSVCVSLVSLMPMCLLLPLCLSVPHMPPVCLCLVSMKFLCTPVPMSACPSSLYVLRDHLSFLSMCLVPSVCLSCMSRMSIAAMPPPCSLIPNVCVSHVHTSPIFTCPLCLFLVPCVSVAQRWYWVHECLVLRTAT